MINVIKNFINDFILLYEFPILVGIIFNNLLIIAHLMGLVIFLRFIFLITLSYWKIKNSKPH